MRDKLNDLFGNVEHWLEKWGLGYVAWLLALALVFYCPFLLLVGVLVLWIVLVNES